VTAYIAARDLAAQSMYAENTEEAVALSLEEAFKSGADWCHGYLKDLPSQTLIEALEKIKERKQAEIQKAYGSQSDPADYSETWRIADQAISDFKKL